MKILSLRVEQFRKFDRPMMIDGIEDGLNLVAGPNETGKSTLLLALRAVLFERHGTKSQAVRDFSPHHVTGARPTITLTFEMGGGPYLLEKSFLKRPAARLETPDGRRFEGSEAEAELKRLLKLDPSEKTTADKDSPAHFGVLLTPQARSFQQPDLVDDTRHTLEAAIAADIAELGNQSEAEGVLAEIDNMLFAFVSKRGEPKNRYKDVAARLSEVEDEINAAVNEREALQGQLEQLADVITARRDILATEGGDEPSKRLAALEAQRKQAVQRQRLDNQRLIANQRVQTLEAKRAAFLGRLEERQRLTNEIREIEQGTSDQRERLSVIEEALDDRQEALAKLSEEQQTASRRQRDLATLAQRLDRLRQVDVTLKALSTDVRLDLEDQALPRVTIDGEPAAAKSDLRQVTEGLSIDIEGVGRISVEPKIEPMREALAAKAELRDDIERLKTVLDLGDVEPEAIETIWQSVASEAEAIEGSRAEHEGALAAERRQAAEIKAALDTAGDQQTRLVRRLEEIDANDNGDTFDQDAVDADIADASAALEAADQALKSAPVLTVSDVSLDRLDRDITDLRARIEERQRALDDAGKKAAALESAIAVRAGLGLDERIDQLDRQRHRLTQERDAFALDHQALSLLQTTLRKAADEARTSFNAPLARRLTPYVQQLLPDATPLVTPDFAIRAIDRNGLEEPFLQLSDGTREQIAILARLAYADMLQEQGLPALLVLDDALAFSDDRRLQRMFAILEQEAERMQIMVFTCREDRFANVKATRLQIVPAPEQASPAA